MLPAIRVSNVTKLYQIGAEQAGGYRTMRESVIDGARSAAQRLARLIGRSGASSTTQEHWALSDVSFDVAPGDVVGIVGRNGAGKSTLLKILSQITEPTSGRVELRGRVGSLLEVGTGFHSELSGRENIFLNGAILGMGRREIKRKFDEIVAFAEIDKFLDTPVKRYSSGMYVRLGFAVAAHLDPEILLVDEVLAVGDTAFQNKCIGKMNDVSREGRTVLFVSHNMAAVKSLCKRGVLLESGRVTDQGTADYIVDKYLMAGTDMTTSGIIPETAPRIGSREASFRTVKLADDLGRPVNELYFGQPLNVTFVCEVLEDLEDILFEVSISSTAGTHVVCSTTDDGGRERLDVRRGMQTVTVRLGVVLLPRYYTIALGLHRRNGATIDYVERTLDFSVTKVAQDASDSYRWSRVRGYVRSPAEWDIRQLDRHISYEPAARSHAMRNSS